MRGTNRSSGLLRSPVFFRYSHARILHVPRQFMFSGTPCSPAPRVFCTPYSRHSIPSGTMCFRCRMVSSTVCFHTACFPHHVFSGAADVLPVSHPRAPRSRLQEALHRVHGTGTTTCRGGTECQREKQRIGKGPAVPGKPVREKCFWHGVGGERIRTFPAVPGIQSPALPFPTRRGCSSDRYSI